MLLLQFLLFMFKYYGFFPDFILHIPESLLFKFYLLTLMFQVPLYLVQLHLMRECAIVKLRENVQALAIVNV